MFGFLGRGGYKGVMGLIKKIRILFFSIFIIVIFNWIVGDFVLEVVFKGFGVGLGEILGGWVGGVIGVFGGFVVFIIVLLGVFIGLMFGSIVGEVIGGWIYCIMIGKMNEGEGLGVLGKVVVEGVKKFWIEFIVNGEFWVGFWEFIKNFGGQIMEGVWNVIIFMWNFVKG